MREDPGQHGRDDLGAWRMHPRGGPGKGGWEEGRWDVLTDSSEPSVLSLTWGTRSSAKTEDDGGDAGGSRKRQKV